MRCSPAGRLRTAPVVTLDARHVVPRTLCRRRARRKHASRGMTSAEGSSDYVIRLQRWFCSRYAARLIDNGMFAGFRRAARGARIRCVLKPPSPAAHHRRATRTTEALTLNEFTESVASVTVSASAIQPSLSSRTALVDETRPKTWQVFIR